MGVMEWAMNMDTARTVKSSDGGLQNFGDDL